MGSEIITCVQCGREFEFTEREQHLAEKMGFDSPRRCPDCRRKKNKIASEDDERKRRDRKRDYLNKDRD
ncbi:MAG: hypothetical protein C4530_15785 [Desulfobacteraceae bacterium]|jgi:DNA-directed RNA polymerase subunit RPC12/RpoP|nr:MAG: hypothetical protein C4530_15785 [Desulfobacteraceae bacterium]